jgi:hypothetical protein
MAVVMLLALGAAALPQTSCNGPSSSPATSDAVPGGIDDQLMHTPTTPPLPILVADPAGDWATALVYDPSIQDPITDWGGCMELARGCYLSTPGSIVGCVRGLPTCGGSDPMTGGSNCCPRKCIDDFNAQIEAGASDNAAVEATISYGAACVAGFAAMLDDGGVSP